MDIPKYRGQPLPHWAHGNYRQLRAALPAAAQLSEEQERYLCWLSLFDRPTTEAFVSLFFLAAGRCPREHLSLAAEQRVRAAKGPCMCPSCVSCRARPMR